MADKKLWKKIKADYVCGGGSTRELSQKYGVSFSTLSKVAAREKWADSRKKARKKADAKIVESVAKAEAKKLDRTLEIADKIEQRIFDNIEAYTMDATSARQIMLALKDLKEIRGQKSPLDIREQEARIRKLEREAAGEEEDKTIKVVIDNSLDDYGV